MCCVGDKALHHGNRVVSCCSQPAPSSWCEPIGLALSLHQQFNNIEQIGFSHTLPGVLGHHFLYPLFQIKSPLAFYTQSRHILGFNLIIFIMNGRMRIFIPLP